MPDRPRQKPIAPPPQDDTRHIADAPLPEPEQPEAGVQPPVTETGLSVEEQVRKEWDPKKSGGLPTSVQRRR